MNFIHKLDGHVIKRPAANHPAPEAWALLREQVLAEQHNYCATCWKVADGSMVFDLHHRHYNNFGNEQREDVIILCRLCHDAITSRIREERFAAGDRSMECSINE